VAAPILGPTGCAWAGYPERPVRIVRDQLAEAIARALKSEGVIHAFRTQEMEPLHGGPAAFAKYIVDETAKWADVATKAGLTKP